MSRQARWRWRVTARGLFHSLFHGAVESVGSFYLDINLETEKLLYTESQAAKLLSISSKTLYRLRKAGKLEFQHIGKAIRYELNSLLTLIDKHTTIEIG